MLYVFISGSAIHDKFISFQKEAAVGRHKAIELKRLCETRWACQSSAIDSVYNIFTFILKTLKWACKQGGSRSIEARGLLLQVKEFDFILLLVIMRNIFCVTRSLSDILQWKNLDLAKACVLVDTTLIWLKRIRFDEEFMKMELEASHFFEENQLIIESQSKRCRKTPENLSNSVIMESVGHEHPNDFTNAKYKEVLDIMIQEIERQFDNQNKSLLRSMQALIPSSK